MLSISIRKNDSSSLLEMIISGKSYDLPGVADLPHRVLPAGLHR